MAADAEDESFTVGVQELQIAQRCRDLVRDDDLVGRLGDGELSAAQVEERVLPVADHASVLADAALPPDRRLRLSPEQDHPTRAGLVGWPPSTRQCAFPGGAGITCCCGANDVAQVLAQSPRRAWGVDR